MRELHNFHAGDFHAAREGGWLDVFEPATGQVHSRVANSSEADVNVAVSAATAAFPGWSALPPEQRAGWLNRLADGIEARLDELSAAESQDTGKPVSLARQVDIPRAVSNFRFFAAAATQFSSESHAAPGTGINYTLRQPLGAVACISPWNLPLYLLTWKIAPALAAGNTVVAKPSEITPLTATLLCEIAADIGLPAGVLNVIHGEGPGAGGPLVTHPDIRAVSFTGSTRTGAWIAQATAKSFKKVSLEMGGKNAALVFADSDLERTADELTRAAFSNQGQICLCMSRVLIEDAVYEDFRDALVERASALRVGDPQDPETQQGAVVSAAHHEKILGHVEIARDEGGTVLCGGGAVTLDGRCAEGWFVAPTLIEGLSNSSRTNQEEIFGPVATLQRFASEDEAIALANDSAYGLAASVWSRDIQRCHRVAQRLASGIVWVNCWMARDLRTPFGGMKQSGVGREGGWEAMRFFTEPRNICIGVDT